MTAIPSSWLVAAGCYHHPAGGAPAARYKSIVSGKLARLNGGIRPDPGGQYNLTPSALPT